MTPSDGRTLGSELRAGRLRFHWMPEVERYVRVTVVLPFIRIEAVEPRDLPGRDRNARIPHVLWWLDPDGGHDDELARELAPVVGRLLRWSGVGPWLVDDHGRRVVPA